MKIRTLSPLAPFSVSPFLRVLLLAAVVLGSAGGVVAATEPAPEGSQATETSEANQGLTAQEQRGKQIYLTGESPDEEPVLAILGQGVEVPASTLPCANCHGRDGKGVSEGGVDPTNLTWPALTKPYGVRHESGREHPPYDLRSLKRAIAMGLDPAGNELHAAMPRYRMSLEDMDALLVYLQRLGRDPDPGVEPDRLHLATLLPPRGSATSSLGQAIQGVLEAYFERLNTAGGLYNRKVVLHSHHLAASPEERREDLMAFVEETPIFAMVGGFIAGADDLVPEVLGERDIPLVGPFTLHPRQGFPLVEEVFYLLSGLPTQGRVMVDRAAENLTQGEGEGSMGPPAVVMYPPGGAEEEAAEAVVQQARLHDWPVEKWPLEGPVEPESLAQRLDERDIRVLFALHPALVGVAEPLLGQQREMYLPGVFGGARLFQLSEEAAGRLILTFPTLPSDQTPRGVDLYRQLAASRELPTAHRAVQLSTLAAAEVLTEGLKQAGRELSREKLILALEGLYDFNTGLTPMLTFNPNRRIGALGAYLVRIDPAGQTFRPLDGFRQPQGR